MEAVTIIVPVKDEEVGLQYLLENFNQSDIKERYIVNFIFVIDYRTSDTSKNQALKFSSNIIDQKLTSGKGSAIRQAVENWKKKPTKFTIFLDADGSYSFEGVCEILVELEKGSDVVSGSRMSPNVRTKKGMSRLHSIGNMVLSKISSLRNGRKISDLCTGLWGFERDALIKLNFKSKGFDLEAEIVGLIRKRNLSHQEVMVDWSQRKGGTSKLRSFTDGFIILLRILRT